MFAGVLCRIQSTHPFTLPMFLRVLLNAGKVNILKVVMFVFYHTLW